MDKVFTGMLCLSKIDESGTKTSEETGQKWIKVGVILLEKPDRFGNNIIIQHRGKYRKDHIIIGNAVQRGEIHFEFPNHIPSKIDTRCETEDSFREFDFEDLP